MARLSGVVSVDMLDILAMFSSKASFSIYTIGKMSIHQKIRQGRLRLGMTEQQFGDAVGVSRGAVQQWEKEGGTAPTRRNQPAVAKLLGMSVAQLMSDTEAEMMGFTSLEQEIDWIQQSDEPINKPERMREARARWTSQTGPAVIELENNPLYPAIRRVKLKAQAGVSGYAVEYTQEDDGPPIVFRADWYKIKGYKPEKMLALRVTGDSMIPSMYEGDLIVINTVSTTPKDGVPFLVSYEGEIVVKRLVRDDGLWWLTSDNPDQRRYSRKVCNGGTEIIGEVVYRQTERV